MIFLWRGSKHRERVFIEREFLQRGSFYRERVFIERESKGRKFFSDEIFKGMKF